MILKGFTKLKGVYEDGLIEGQIYLDIKDISTIIEVENTKFNEKYTHVIILKNKDRILANMEEIKL